MRVTDNFAAAFLASPLSSVDYLRAELAAAPTEIGKALLLYEIAYRQEVSGDDGGAARDYLAAVSTSTEFREPLQALIAVLQRRRSFKSVGRLLDSLICAARTPEEMAVSLTERGAFQLEQENDRGAAKGLFEQAVAERPGDVTAWLELELIAGKEGDVEQQHRALRERAAQAEPSPWRSLLLIDLADLEARAGDTEQAVSTLRAAAGLPGGARSRAFFALGELARREENPEWLAEALGAQADLLAEALQDDSGSEARGIPAYRRTPLVLADLLVRAAYASRRAGDLASPALLDRAGSIVPDSLAVLYLRLLAADRAGEFSTAARLAQELLARGAGGREAASLWLRVHKAAVERGDVAAATQAVAAAVQADPASAAARVLRYEALKARDDNTPADVTALPMFLEAVAEQRGNDSAKGRAYLLAAWAWANDARDNDGAKTALSHAGFVGVAPVTVARVARWIATLHEDPLWQEEATKRLLTAGVSAKEQPGLWFELGRARCQRGDADGAVKAWEALAAFPSRAWLSRLLLAYAAPLLRSNGNKSGTVVDAFLPAAALDELALVEPEPPMARGLVLAAARRAQGSGDLLGAEQRLADLLAHDASDVLAAGYLAQLIRQRGDVVASAQVLHTVAAAREEDLAAALHLEAAFMLWHHGARSDALGPLQAAAALSPAAANPVLLWALHALAPDDPVVRRQLIDLELDAGENVSLGQLRRFAQEIAPGGEPGEAQDALATLETMAVGELRLAAACARLVWPPGTANRPALGDALALFEGAGEEAEALARGERTRLARDVDADALAYAHHAASWAEAEPTVAAALEWLTASTQIEDRDGEIGAHRLLSMTLPASTGAAQQVAAETIRWLTSGGALPDPVPSKEPCGRLFNLELAPAGADPRRRRAALVELGDALGADSAIDAVALAGWSELALGQEAEALHSFQTVTTHRPDDLAAWEGVRTAATRLADAATAALAASKLGALCLNPERAAAFWEEAGLLWLDGVGDEDTGERALAQAFQLDPQRQSAFDRLFRRVRGRGEDELLLSLVDQRLDVAEDTTEIVKLYWERARVLRKQGDQAAALEALTNVTLLEADHVGALALSGEIFIKQKNYAEAAEALARLASLEAATTQQRLMSGMAAADLYEKRLDEPTKALESLLVLHRAGLSNLPVRERLAVLAGKAGLWVQAASVFEDLMRERDTPNGRAEAASLAMAIWRDKMNEPENARAAVAALLEERPSDPECLALVLTTDFDAPFKTKALEAGRQALTAAIQVQPLATADVEQLARLARSLGDAPLLQSALGALVALGRSDPKADAELASLDQRTAKVPQIQVDGPVLIALNDPHDKGPLTALFSLLGEVLGEALGPSKEVLGVSRRERVDPRGGLPLRNEVAAWAGALGLGEFELYIGGRDLIGVQGVAGEIPALVVGAGVMSPLSVAARQAVARELFALRRGLTIVRTRDEATVAAVAVAACALVDVRLEAPPFAMLGDVQRQLARALSRKVKKSLPDLAQDIAASREDVLAWAQAAQRSVDRVAALAAGDVSWVLADVFQVPRPNLSGAIAHHARAEQLLRFVLSPGYLQLRKHLGMGVR